MQHQPEKIFSLAVKWKWKAGYVCPYSWLISRTWKHQKLFENEGKRCLKNIFSLIFYAESLISIYFIHKLFIEICL
jgi:hypothetical protein